MDFIKKQFSAKINVLEPIEFRLPIQTIDTFNEVNQNIIDDMELTKGENPMYKTIFGMKSDFEKLILVLSPSLTVIVSPLNKTKIGNLLISLNIPFFA